MTDTTAAQPLDLDKLEALAKAATPGPWATKLQRHVIPAAHSERRIGSSTSPAEDKAEFAHEICAVRGKYQPDRENAAFIAAANPDTILALIAQARTARLDTTASASIGKDAKFLELLSRHQAAELACDQDGSDNNREASNEAWEALIAYLDSRAAHPVQAGEAVDERALTIIAEAAKKAMRNYRMSNMICGEGDPCDAYPLVDLLSTEGESIATGQHEIDLIVDAIYEEARATLAPVCRTCGCAPCGCVAPVAAQQAAATECSLCNDSGIVGFPPDQYESCPDCTRPINESGPTSEQNARFAIDAAIQYGRENRNQPPSTDHWLYEYWNIGRQLAKLGETAWDNVTSMAAAKAPAAQAVDARAAVLDEAIAEIGKLCQVINDPESDQYIALQTAMKKVRGLKRAASPASTPDASQQAGMDEDDEPSGYDVQRSIAWGAICTMLDAAKPGWECGPGSAVDRVCELLRAGLARAEQAAAVAAPSVLPAELSNAFITLESSGGEGRTIVLKFNQRDDAHAVHDFLLKGGGKEWNVPTAVAATTELEKEVSIMYQMLDDGEWAEHIATSCLGQQLETAITRLVGKVKTVAATTREDAREAGPLPFHVIDDSNTDYPIYSSHRTIEEAEEARMKIAEECRRERFAIMRTGGGLERDFSNFAQLKAAADLAEKQDRVIAFSCNLRAQFPDDPENQCEKWCGDETKCLAAMRATQQEGGK